MSEALINWNGAAPFHGAAPVINLKQVFKTSLSFLFDGSFLEFFDFRLLKSNGGLFLKILLNH